MWYPACDGANTANNKLVVWITHNEQILTMYIVY